MGFLEKLSQLVVLRRLPKFSKMGKGLWRLILPSIFWSIWLERNQKIFENYLKPSFKVFKRAMDNWCFWATNCKRLNGHSFVDVKKGWGIMILDSCL